MSPFAQTACAASGRTSTAGTVEASPQIVQTVLAGSLTVEHSAQPVTLLPNERREDRLVLEREGTRCKFLAGIGICKFIALSPPP